MEISRRESCGKGMTAMSTVPTATRAKTGRRTRMDPEKPMGSAVPGICGSRRPGGFVTGSEGFAHRALER